MNGHGATLAAASFLRNPWRTIAGVAFPCLAQSNSLQLCGWRKA
jgi:hypothetical protein